MFVRSMIEEPNADTIEDEDIEDPYGDWYSYGLFTCEVCRKEFRIKTNRDFRRFRNLGLDTDLLDEWEHESGVPVCLDCLEEHHGVARQ